MRSLNEHHETGVYLGAMLSRILRTNASEQAGEINDLRTRFSGDRLMAFVLFPLS